MPDNTVNQSHINAGRDVAAGDIIHNYPRKTPLEHLYDRFRAEEQSVEVVQMVEKLKHYSTPIEGETVIGLEAKLQDGGRITRKEFAEKCKELFAKRLAKVSFSVAAQEIYSFLLAQVWSKFCAHVSPNIGEKTPADVDQLVQTHVIDAIRNDLGENLFSLCEDDIYGMLYFLTGNCHVKWTAP